MIGLLNSNADLSLSEQSAAAIFRWLAVVEADDEAAGVLNCNVIILL